MRRPACRLPAANSKSGLESDRKRTALQKSFAAPAGEEIAILVGLHLTGSRPPRPAAARASPAASTGAPAAHTAEESLTELASLAATAGAGVACRQIQARPRADAATLIGSGKVDELKSLIHF